MEKFDKLRKEWVVTLKTLKSMPTQALYFLLEPDDDSRFFESVDSFKDCIEETQFPDFQTLAIVYLLEYKKQNKPKITTEPYMPNITYINDNIYSTSIAPGIPACRCIGCEFFDGYDICCHHENFGSITQQSLDNCKKHNLLREKIYDTSNSTRRKRTSH